MKHDEKEIHWNLESLNKAYQQGYMAGLTGHPQAIQRCDISVPSAAWEAGWTDGAAQRHASKQGLTQQLQEQGKRRA
jgi:ribosome modulation factor